MKKRIAILGSTGSIGKQTLEVINQLKSNFSVEVLTAGKNAELLIKQAKEYKPNSVVIADESKYKLVFNALDRLDIKVYAGNKAIEEIVESNSIDIVLTAMVGFSGLLPTINAIKHKKRIALANKETLVVAGELITKLVQENKVSVYPVDSEHSAIFQCITGEEQNEIEKIYLTASGGPFRGKSIDFLKTVTKSQALKHPNWDMGAKITIDSASMMNKGLEVIEAKWLFNLKHEQIDVIVHPQSIIHSLVQFTDGSIKAQLGLPDMKLPIQHALSFPQRLKNDFPRFNFVDYSKFTFEKPDTKAFRNITIAYEAMKSGGIMPCVMNAANEIVVSSFLNDKIGFLQMSEIIEETILKIKNIKNPSISDYLEADSEARKIASDIIVK